MTLQHALLQLDTSANKAYSIINNSTLNTVIMDYATDSTKKGSEIARAVMRQVYGTPVYLERLVPVEDGGRLMAPHSGTGQVSIIQKAKKNVDITTGLKVYPNPAANNFTILYNDSGIENIYFTISNMLGTVIAKDTLFRSKDYIVSTENLNQGLYIISINNGVNILGQQKLIIIK